MKKRAHQIRPLLILLIPLAALATFLIPTSSHATIQTVTGTVTKVSDGDTIQVNTSEGTKLRVRLYGMDAPETEKMNRRTGRVSKPGQPYGDESWRALEEKISGKQVRLDIIDIDRYHRMVGMIWMGSRNINLEVVREGYAEACVEYLREPYRGESLAAQGRIHT